MPIPGMPPPQDPPGRRTIAPVSMEILSCPLPDFIGGAGTLGGTSTGGGGGGDKRGHSHRSQQHYGVRLRVAGSGWTQPMAVNALNGGRGDDSNGAVDTLQSAEPVLIQAEAREYGVVYEVTARLEISPFKNSQVLRLEPHVVITNRTSVPLQLLQCRPVAGQPAPAASLSQHPGAHIVPEGGINVVSGATRGVNALHIAPDQSTGNGPSLVRPLLRGVSDRPAAREESIIQDMTSNNTINDAIRDLEATDATTTAAGASAGDLHSQQHWKSVPTMLPSASLVHLPHPSQQISHSSGAILELPAGTVAVPLHLVQGLYRSHVLCFRYATHDDTATTPELSMLPGSGSGMGGSASAGRGLVESCTGAGVGFLWSRPISILQDREGEYSVVIPVSATSKEGSSFGEGGIALMRLTVHTRGPGMLHIVLESVNSDPPFLLENRTPFGLNYRQVRKVI